LTGEGDAIDAAPAEALRRALMSVEDTVIEARPAEMTHALTTAGIARGRLVGGHLETIAAGAGWALPPLDGAVLLLEAVNMGVGQADRLLTMLRKAGHLAGLAGVALGQFVGFTDMILDVLAGHLDALGVPVLGGLPLGHGSAALPVPVGAEAILDVGNARLIVPARRASIETSPYERDSRRGC
jgi:muramoyltetrapeptide carboxypeptidase